MQFSDLPISDGRVDIGRLVQVIDQSNLSELEKLIIQQPVDYQQLLKEARANPEVAKLRWNGGATLLHFVVGQGDLPFCQLLLDQGADVNAFDSELGTPLHMAGGNRDVIMLLLHADAYVNSQDSGGRTPLYFACISHDIDTIKLLLNNKAAPTDPYSIEYIHNLRERQLLE
jgi:ankyrin repeat protein